MTGSTKCVVPESLLTPKKYECRFWSGVGLLAIYYTYVRYVAHLPLTSLHDACDDVYSVTSLVLGLVFGCYSGYHMNHWWDLRVATGTVAGSLVDIAMVCNGYSRQVSIHCKPQAIESIARNLRLAYLQHLIEIGVLNPKDCYGLDDYPKETKSTNLIGTLSIILGEITTLSEELPFSDSVKFSLLPSVQSNLSTIRSSSGDCTMILGTNYPLVFQHLIYCFTGLHFAYLPVYLTGKTGGSSLHVTAICMLAFVFIAGFVLMIETHFRNPFAFDSFRISDIWRGTFASIDQCFGTTSLYARKTKVR